MTGSVKHNLHLAHTTDSNKESYFFSSIPLDPFSIPQHLSMWNIEDVPIPDSPKEKQIDYHQAHFEQRLHKIATTLEESMDAMWSKKPAPKDNLMTLPKPRFSFKHLRRSLLHWGQEFIAPQTTWNNLYALTLLPTALAEFMTPLPNRNRLPLPAQDTKLRHLLPLPLLPEMSWNDFLCPQDIEPNSGHSVYGMNVNPIWKEKATTTTPLDLVISMPLAPSILPHASLLPTTQSEDMSIDGLSLPPSPMMMDIPSSIL